MSFIEATNRGKINLLPVCVDDYVAPELLVGVVSTPQTRRDAPEELPGEFRHSLGRQASRSEAADYVFIESKNSPLFFVLRSLSSRKSMASMVPIGLRIRRSTYIFLS